MRHRLTAAVALALVPTAALAHPGLGDAHGFAHGFAHPLGPALGFWPRFKHQGVRRDICTVRDFLLIEPFQETRVSPIKGIYTHASETDRQRSDKLTRLCSGKLTQGS